MTPAEAKSYILAHDEDAKVLNRKNKAYLVAIEKSELAARGITRLGPCPLSKDELVNHIADLRFPHLREARDIYYRSVTA